MNTAPALARRGEAGRALTVRPDVLHDMAFCRGAGASDAMSRAVAASEGDKVIGLVCRELHALCRLVERVTCSDNHNCAHTRRIIWALNEAASTGEEEEEEDGNDSE